MKAPPSGSQVPLTAQDLFAEAARRSAAREAFALCTVAATERSSPRDAGAKMLVSPEGALFGTVGGGPLEAVVISEAVELLKGDQGCTLRTFSLDAGGQSAAAHLPVPPSSLAPDSDFLGMKCGGMVQVLIDVVRPPPRLLVYGAGHVGERVAALAGEIGLTCVVIDDRPEFVQPQRFARATALLRDLEADSSGGLVPDASDFVVIVTRCHALDEKVLETALKSRARYLGLIGSKRKVGVLLKAIALRTGQDPRCDARLHAPIGLKLGDKTPGEIALSILAEVVLVKSGGALEHARLAPKAATEASSAGALDRNGPAEAPPVR